MRTRDIKRYVRAKRGCRNDATKVHREGCRNDATKMHREVGAMMGQKCTERQKIDVSFVYVDFLL